MNTGYLVGRLARDPKDYSGVVKITIAVDRGTDSNGNKVADFPTVTVFGKQAANCMKYLSKGRHVAVEYTLRTGSYTDKDGKTVYTQEPVARQAVFCDSPTQSQTKQAPVDPTQLEYDYEGVEDDVPF